MKRLIVALSILSVTTACGMSEEEFADENLTIVCELTIECADETTLEFLGYSTVEDCVATFDSETETDDDHECEFDPDAAQVCLDEYSAMTCDDYSTGNFPSCADVYTCP